MSGLKKSGANSLKESEKKRKQVFKPVLDNPLTQSNVWPFVEPEIGTSLVDLLQHLLTPIGRYNEAKKAPKGQWFKTGFFCFSRTAFDTERYHRWV